MERRHGVRALLVSAVLLLAAVAVAGCGSQTGGRGGFDSRGADPQPVEAQQRRLALGNLRVWVQVPAGTAIDPPRAVQVGDCEVLAVDVPTVRGSSIQVSSVPDDCTPGPQQALNGRLGYYRSFEDVAEGGPTATQATPAGPASLGSISYTACTNSCRTTDVRVAFVRLSAPTDPNRTTIQVLERPWQQSSASARADFAEFVSRIGAD